MNIFSLINNKRLSLSSSFVSESKNKYLIILTKSGDKNSFGYFLLNSNMKLFNCVNDIKHFLQNERLIPEKLIYLESFFGIKFDYATVDEVRRVYTGIVPDREWRILPIFLKDYFINFPITNSINHKSLVYNGFDLF